MLIDFSCLGNKSITPAINEVTSLRETVWADWMCAGSVACLSECVCTGLSVPGGGLHNHFQLSCVFNDLLCQLRGGDGHFFCPLLLTGKRVIAICALSPASLKWNETNSQLWLCGHFSIQFLEFRNFYHLSLFISYFTALEIHALYIQTTSP